MKVGHDSLSTKSQLNVDGKTYHYYSLKEAEKNNFKGISRLPYSLKVLFENLLRLVCMMNLLPLLLVICYLTIILHSK